MVRPVGLEPTTNGVEVRYSIQLSYGRNNKFDYLSIAIISKLINPIACGFSLNPSTLLRMSETETTCPSQAQGKLRYCGACPP